MMDVLQGLGYGIVAFAVLVIVGLVVLTKLQTTVAVCPIGFDTAPGGYNESMQTCMNNTADVTNTSDPTNSEWTTSGYLQTQLGSTGLVGWIPAIIAVAVGALFLSYFMARKRR